MSIQQIAIIVTCSISSLLMIVATRTYALHYLRRLRFWHFVAAFLILRLSAFVVIYWVYGFESTGDLVQFSHQAHRLMDGTLTRESLIPGYGPFFPHTLAAVSFFTGDALLIDLFWLCCDCLAFIVGDRFFVSKHIPETLAVYRILYILCPISWFMVVGLGQEEPLFALMGELVILTAFSGFSWLSGVLFACTCAITKILFGLYGFLGWTTSKNKLTFVIGAGLAGLALFVLPQRLEMFSSVSGQYYDCLSSVNVWVALSPVLPGSNANMWVLPVVLFGGMLFSWIYPRTINHASTNFKNTCYLILLNWFLFFLFSPKSLAPYRLGILPFIIMYIAIRNFSQRYIIYLFAVYSFILSIQYTFWEDWVQAIGYLEDVNSSIAYVFILIVVGMEASVLIDLLTRLLAPMQYPNTTPQK